MEILTVINLKINLRTHNIRGAINLFELIGYLKDLYNSSDFNPELNDIWDLRNADFSSISSEDVRSLMKYVSKKWGKSGKNKAVIVVSSELDYGMSRMYEILMEARTTGKIAVYKDINEAIEWIQKE